MSRTPHRWARRLTGLLALLVSLALLSGCAGWSARVTIVPSHAAYDIDLIYAQVDKGGEEGARAFDKECTNFGPDAESSHHDGNGYCRLRVTVGIDDNQTFVKRKGEHWSFKITKKTLYEFMVVHFKGLQEQYPEGFNDDVFDDFKLQVDMPGTVVSHNADRVDGSTVIWNSRAKLFSDEGMHAESDVPATWKYIMGAVGALGALALIGGLIFSLAGYRRSRGATRTWPPAHVVQWWERNGERWLREQREGPGQGKR